MNMCGLESTKKVSETGLELRIRILEGEMDRLGLKIHILESSA